MLFDTEEHANAAAELAKQGPPEGSPATLRSVGVSRSSEKPETTRPWRTVSRMLGSALPAERNAGQNPVPIDASDLRPVLDEGEQVARLVDAGLPVGDRRVRHAKLLGDGSLI